MAMASSMFKNIVNMRRDMNSNDMARASSMFKNVVNMRRDMNSN